MGKHSIYWWNLENLFDVEDSASRPGWLAKTLKSELQGWNETVLDKKLTNLCSVIQRLNDGNGPDILGVCEIENASVVGKLVERAGQATGRNYKVLHHDMNDQRGIDIALIYDIEKYSDDGQIFSLEVIKRNATRDLFQVQLTTKAGNELVLIGNHWPARTEGQYESEPFRIIVAETLAYWVERIHEKKGENTSIVVMGDFNDNPFDRSIRDYLQASGIIKKVVSARNHLLYNPMYQFLATGQGTHVFGSEISVLDQFMVSKSIVSKKADCPFFIESVKIISFEGQVKGGYNTPVRFGRPSSEYNPEGYSDHLPIELILSEKC